MGGSGTPEGCLSQAQLSKGKVSVSVQGSLCSIENWWEPEGAQALEDMENSNFPQEDLLAPSLLPQYYFIDL